MCAAHVDRQSRIRRAVMCDDDSDEDSDSEWGDCEGLAHALTLFRAASGRNHAPSKHNGEWRARARASRLVCAREL